jgi:hypothetical protein
MQQILSAKLDPTVARDEGRLAALYLLPSSNPASRGN